MHFFVSFFIPYNPSENVFKRVSMLGIFFSELRLMDKFPIRILKSPHPVYKAVELK